MKLELYVSCDMRDEAFVIRLQDIYDGKQVHAIALSPAQAKKVLDALMVWSPLASEIAKSSETETTSGATK